jgi:REP element-mobilizing transposase RayT
MAFVVMPNHVHAAIIPREGWHLEKLIQSWKQWTAKRINAVTGASGTFWQTDYFDTIVRDREHLGRVLRYIRNNPIKANLRLHESALYESDYAKQFIGAGIS